MFICVCNVCHSHNTMLVTWSLVQWYIIWTILISAAFNRLLSIFFIVQRSALQALHLAKLFNTVNIHSNTRPSLGGHGYCEVGVISNSWDLEFRQNVNKIYQTRYSMFKNKVRSGIWARTKWSSKISRFMLILYLTSGKVVDTDDFCNQWSMDRHVGTWNCFRNRS